MEQINCMEPIVYINGRFIPSSKAYISAFDSGFLFGYGLFETMRGYRGKAFALKEHLERLGKGCERLMIPKKFNLDNTKRLLETLLKKNLLTEVDSYIRLTLTGGRWNDPFSRNISQPTLFIYCRPLDPAIEEKTRKGIRGIILKKERGDSSGTASYKTTNYLPMLLGRLDAQEKGVEEGFFINHRGELTEGCTTNIFILYQGKLLTPPKNAGILPGITRNFVIQIARDMGIPLAERPVFPEHLFNADEAFVTNSLIEIAPLFEINGKKINNCKTGELTKRLQEAYHNLIKTNI